MKLIIPKEIGASGYATISVEHQWVPLLYLMENPDNKIYMRNLLHSESLIPEVIRNYVRYGQKYSGDLVEYSLEEYISMAVANEVKRDVFIGHVFGDGGSICKHFPEHNWGSVKPDNQYAIELFEKFGETPFTNGNARVIEVPDGIDYDVYRHPVDRKKAVVYHVLSRHRIIEDRALSVCETPGMQRILLRKEENTYIEPPESGIRLSDAGDVEFRLRANLPVYVYTREWIWDELKAHGIDRDLVMVDWSAVPWRKIPVDKYQQLVYDAIGERMRGKAEDFVGYVTFADLGDETMECSYMPYEDNYNDRTDPIILSFYDNRNWLVFVSENNKYGIAKFPIGSNYYVTRDDRSDEYVVVYGEIYE